MSDTARVAFTRRMSFVALIAWISICLLVAGLFPHMGTALGQVWIYFGLFGLVASVGLSEAIKTEVRTQSQVLDTYITESRTDALTGLANRRSLDQRLEEYYQEWQRDRMLLSVLLIDVDHFKRLNDTHGHQAGDEVLRGVAHALSVSMSPETLVTRYGGEEFAILLPETGLTDAVRIAEDLRKKVADYQVTYRGTLHQVTVSIGVAQAMLTDTPNELAVRADASLYAAKNAGRNRSFYHDGTESHAFDAPA